MRRDWLKLLALVVPVLTGCLSHTRKLQQAKLAGTVMNADAVQLVEAVNKRYEQVNSLTATVDFAVTKGGAHTGKQTDYTSIHGFVLFRKPDMLRVIGQVPIVRTTAFNLASNGSTFTLVIPHYNRAIQGSTSVTTKSADPMENMRPQFFLDAIEIHGIAADRIVALTTSSTTKLDLKTKQLIETPLYDLTVLNPGRANPAPGLPQVDKPTRVIHFSRIDLMPTGQDVYNSEGAPETKVSYGPYQDFGGVSFPSTITIDRPLEEYRITLNVEKVVFNIPLTDEQFQPTIPKGYKVEKMP
jgi:outer membrane lipoprotein-sorting protein